MDLVKIGFQINANGLKDANTEVDKLLTKVTRVSSKSINLKVKLDNSIQTVKKTLSDVEKIKNNLSALNIKVSMVGYSQVKANLEKLEALKKSVKDVQVRFTTIGNVNKIRDDFIKLKNKIITVKVVTSTAQLDNLKKKLDSIKNKTIKLNINLPKSSEVEKLGKALDKLTNKKVKIEVILTPDLTTVKEYANALDRIRSSRATTTTNLGGGTGGSGGRSPAGAFDQVIGIAKYALLSTAIYGVMTATTNLAVATVKMADEYTSIQNRMKLYINDSQTLATVNRNLGKMAMENNVGLRETATLYTRLAPALQKIGGNAATVTAVVDAFGKSMRIGGATAMEAASATIQFSQAMASGKLAGDEFRSISEASPRFLKAIADGSGIATESLKKLSSEGFLTTSLVARALLKEYPTLIEENKKLGVTLEQGGNAFKTAFIMAVGELNEGAKVTETIGNALMDVAKNLSEFAQTARQTGVEAKASFEKYIPVIQAVGNVLEFVAIVAITKFAASMIVAGATSGAAMIKTTVQIAGLVRTLGVANAAAFALSVTMARLGGGGLATLALTIAGVAASYLFLRDNAAQATSKIAEQSEYVDLTTEAYKKLNSEQQKNAQSSLTEDMNKTNAELDSQANAVNRVLLSYTQFKQMQGKALNKETSDVINQTVKGLISYDTAYRKLIDLGVPKNVVEDFKKQKDVYDEAAKAGLKTEAAARAAGLGIKLAGNEAQNATPAVQGLKGGVDGLAAASLNTADSFAKMVEGFKTGVADIKTTLKVMQSYDLEKGIAQQLIKEGQGIAKQTPEIVDAYSKIKKAQESELNRLGDKPDKKRVEAINKHYSNLMKVVEGHEKRLANEWVKLGAPAAKELQDWTDKESKFISDQNKKDKPPKKSDINNYLEQIAELERIQQLLAKNVDYEVAKVAASKEYYENIKGTAVAEQVILAQQTQKRLEYLATLSEEEDIQTRAILLQQKGASYAQSRALAEAGFREDADGLLALQKLMTNELYAQHYSLDDQLSWYSSINKMLKDGVSLEEATTRATFSRLEATKKGLTDSEKSLMKLMIAQQKNLKDKETERQVTLTLNNAEKQRVAYVNAQAGGYANLIKNMAIANKMASDPTLSPDQAKKLVEAEELTNYEKELAELKRQTYIATLNESEAVKTLVGNYSTMDSVQIGVLAKQQQLLEIAKELAEEAEKQKNPLGDFSNVDFSVFGDFGNPFQSALDGMNELIRTTTEGGEIIKQLTEEINAAKIMGLDTADRELELGKRTEKQANDKKKATDKAITSGLALTKSLFKEESKGYKVVSGMEKAYQASKVAFTLWEKKDVIAFNALKLQAYVTDTLGFTTGAYAKIVAQQALNVAQAQGAVASAAQAPPPVGFASAAAMIALLAGIGIAIGGGSGGGSYVDTSNQGTGTVFGDSEAKSASIANSIDLLSENSDLMLPLTSAMLRSLRSIESNIGGVTNLILRSELGKGFNVSEGFQQDKLGSLVGNVGSLALGVGGAVGGSIAGAFGAGLLGAGMGSALGVGLGLATGGIGLLLGASVGKLLGGLFGTKTTVKASGLYGGDQKLGDILSKGFNLQEYVDIQTKKKTLGVTTSNKSSTKYSKADAELSKQFTLIFKGFYDTILSATDILGADMSAVQTNLENAVVSIGKINLKGLSGEEIQEKLEAVFGAAADDLAKQAFGGLEDFQTVGEGYYETLVKVASAVEEAAYYTDRLNVTAINYTNIINKQADDLATEIIRQSYLTKVGISTIKGGMTDLVNSFDGSAEEITDFINTLEDLQEQLFMTGKSGDYLTSSMILGAGGLDSLASGLDAYFEMLSPAEQAAELTRRLTNEFAIFGKELPADVKAFRNLVSSIDITTEAGQKLYGQIIALAPEFNDLQDALDSANSEVNALVQSLRDLAEQARAARGETEQPRNLDYLRNEFNKASELALQGDTEAANRLASIGEDLMSASKLYSVTGSDYAKDLAYIQGVATAVADLQESGLGTSISPTLTPSTGTGTTTPTIATTNSTMTTEMKAMREEFNAGLLAIAKFVQNVDSRTERWDDGNRVMVGIQPENGDTPVPVVVTP